MALAPGSFIEIAPGLLPDERECLHYALARFDTGAFVPGLYAAHGIDHPPALQGKADKRQAEYLAGRLCARTLLDFHGHPGFVLHAGEDRAPVWPADLVGSISHKGHYAAVIVHPRRNIEGIGIDLESVMTDERAARIAGAIMTPAELARLVKDDFGLAVSLVFSAKESFFKAAFAQVGDWFGFDAIELVEIDRVQGRMAFVCVKVPGTRFIAGTPVEAGFRMVDGAIVMTWVVVRTLSAFQAKIS